MVSVKYHVKVRECPYWWGGGGVAIGNVGSISTAVAFGRNCRSEAPLTSGSGSSYFGGRVYTDAGFPAARRNPTTKNELVRASEF